MKTLILIRHAHRDLRNRELDNGLSDKGRKQRRRLTRYYRKNRAEQLDQRSSRLQLLSSPKKRCQETLEKIAQLEKREVRIDPLLMEQQSDESLREFQARVRKWIRGWSRSSRPYLILCSHGDWLLFAIQEMTGARVVFEKGAWAEIVQKKRGAPLELGCLIQVPR